MIEGSALAHVQCMVSERGPQITMCIHAPRDWRSTRDKEIK